MAVFSAVKKMITTHFVHLPNEVHEMVRFPHRVQEPGESVDSLYMVL